MSSKKCANFLKATVRDCALPGLLVCLVFALCHSKNNTSTLSSTLAASCAKRETGKIISVEDSVNLHRLLIVIALLLIIFIYYKYCLLCHRGVILKRLRSICWCL